ncbi:MAG TPA: hypothetical protein VLL08_26905 [Kineosporiaceae bacterium]|nr:hypothetical protein [Kineosporiaceae bacterium]
MTRSRLTSGVLVSAVISSALIAVPGLSASAATTECPTSFPTASAVDGVTGTGYTVERGTTADPFTATVLGRITDGIAPGIDMIMADLASPALTRAGGVWAGMSGSPVYAADGRLIGSVSYGLAASSPIAGITPAEDMAQLLSAPATASTKIKVNAGVAKRIAKTGDVTAAAADDGFVQLKVPVSVSGVTGHSAKFLKHLKKTAGVRVRSNGARISAAASSPTEITAGSNFAAALSYGDISIAGVGTTTFVCDGEAVAFGHPLIDAGSVQFSAHPATAVYIQPDPTYGPFKVANPGGPVGTVDQDRTTGIRAKLGQDPSTSFPVTTSLVPAGGTAVTGTTTGVYQPWAADIAALHLQSNIVKALGSDGGGSAALTFTIKGQTAGGWPFTLVRSDHYSDPDYISYAAADDMYGLIAALVYQPFKDVKITSVNVTGTVDTAINQYRVTSVKMYKNGKWVKQRGTIHAKAGKTVYRQVTLTKYRSSQTIIAKLKVKIPAHTQGSSGSLLISDGWNAGFSESEPKSLTGLLKQLSSLPTQDAVAGTLSLDGAGKSVNTVTLSKVNAKVLDYYRTLNIVVAP